jgi:N-sulfoglucosamine sulfohydrolase
MPRRNGDRPNIVYIDCHDLGDWLGCYGRPDLHTPHLDELASAGARFGMHIATAPICIPSRSSMYTGSLPHEVGVIGQEPLAPGTICMAARFRRAGYRTVLCGRLMIPNDAHWVGFARQIATVPEEQAAAATAFIESQRGDSAPFLLQVSFTQCHRPFGAAFDPELPERIAVPPYLPDTAVTRRDLATLAWQIHDMDDRIGRILAAIDSAGLRERTLVVFTTEHGPAVARAKHTIYDSGLRTALLMRLPGVIAPGRTIDELSSNVDLLPTLTDLCRLERPQGIQGTSWAGQLAGDEPAAPLRRWAFSQLNWGRRSGRWYYTPARSIRTSRYKLIRSYRRVPIFVDNGWLARYAGDRPTVERWYGSPLPDTQLFDLAEDPSELRDLAGDPALADVEARLRERLDQHLRATGDPVLRGPVANRAGEPDVCQWQEQPDGSFSLTPDDPMDSNEASFT